MLGLDKKALEKLRELRDSDKPSEQQRAIVSSMLEAYSNPEWHFFTSAQRRLIGEIHAACLAPPTPKDREALESMDEALADENLQGWERERLLSILGNRGRSPAAFSPYEKKFVKDLPKKLRERGRQAEVRVELERAVDEGRVREGAEEFCRSIIAQFDERRSWTPVQMEHAEKILAGNRDPGDKEF